MIIGIDPIDTSNLENRQNLTVGLYLLVWLSPIFAIIGTEDISIQERQLDCAAGIKWGFLEQPRTTDDGEILVSIRPKNGQQLSRGGASEL